MSHLFSEDSKIHNKYYFDWICARRPKIDFPLFFYYLRSLAFFNIACKLCTAHTGTVHYTVNATLKFSFEKSFAPTTPVCESKSNVEGGLIKYTVLLRSIVGNRRFVSSPSLSKKTVNFTEIEFHHLRQAYS